MAVINFGSINVDHVYQVDHFVQPGETLASTNYQCLLGGKGANLAEMTNLNIPVPPGFTITTEACIYFMKHAFTPMIFFVVKR